MPTLTNLSAAQAAAISEKRPNYKHSIVIISCVAALLGLVACSDDELATPPESGLSDLSTPTNSSEVSTTASQTPLPALFVHTLGGNDLDYFRSVTVADNGDIITVGDTWSTDGDFPTTHSDNDAVIARFTPTGDLIWAHTYGGNHDDLFFSVTVADNGDIITVGYTRSTDGDLPTTHGPGDAVIARFTPTGDLLWAHTHGGNSWDSFSSVAVAGNGDIITVGDTFSTDGDFPTTHGDDNGDAVIARFTLTGNLIWAHTYGGNSDDSFDDDSFNSVTLADNGDIITAGYTDSTDGDFPTTHRASDAVIARFTPTGDLT
ncbi:MAG: hypothetical protein LBN10_05740 [Propionibacteriaceae bacterium]|jgi:hypothetical protein|nr:hypothetical protein [Propionibacteriaceae bacterium]